MEPITTLEFLNSDLVSLLAYIGWFFIGYSIGKEKTTHVHNTTWNYEGKDNDWQ